MNEFETTVGYLNGIRSQKYMIELEYAGILEKIERQRLIHVGLLSLDWTQEDLVNPQELPKLPTRSQNYYREEIEDWETYSLLPENANFLIWEMLIVILDYHTCVTHSREVIDNLIALLEATQTGLISDLVKAYTHNW